MNNLNTVVITDKDVSYDDFVNVTEKNYKIKLAQEAISRIDKIEKVELYLCLGVTDDFMIMSHDIDHPKLFTKKISHKIASAKLSNTVSNENIIDIFEISPDKNILIIDTNKLTGITNVVCLRRSKQNTKYDKKYLEQQYIEIINKDYGDDDEINFIDYSYDTGLYSLGSGDLNNSKIVMHIFREMIKNKTFTIRNIEYINL